MLPNHFFGKVVFKIITDFLFMDERIEWCQHTLVLKVRLFPFLQYLDLAFTSAMSKEIQTSWIRMMSDFRHAVSAESTWTATKVAACP